MSNNLKEEMKKALDLDKDGDIDLQDLIEAITFVAVDGKINIQDFISLSVKIISNMA